MILLYAVVPADAGPRAAAAVADVSAGTEAGVTGGGVALVYREIESAPTADREEVLRFGSVLTSLAECTTLLPVRFGTVLPSLDRARELLHARGHGWRERLDDLVGQVELIVHVGDDDVPASAVVAPTSGGDYLRAKVAERRRRAGAVDEVAAVVTPWCRAARPLSPGDVAEVRLACLVAVEDEARLREAVDGWGAGHPQRPVTVTGPFPVFSFTEDVSSCTEDASSCTEDDVG